MSSVSVSSVAAEDVSEVQEVVTLGEEVTETETDESDAESSASTGAAVDTSDDTTGDTTEKTEDASNTESSDDAESGSDNSSSDSSNEDDADSIEDTVLNADDDSSTDNVSDGSETDSSNTNDNVTWADTEYITNGNFEESDNAISDWNATIESNSSDYGIIAKTNEWSSNNKTTMLNYWCKGDTASISMYQTISELPAGTYRISYDQEGEKETESFKRDISIEVTSGDDTVLTEAMDTYNTGWDSWATCTTDSFTIDETSEITITISGDITAGYWGDFDNIILQTVSDGTTDTYVESSINVSKIDGVDSDFIMGVDISSYLSERNSGVKFYDFDGNELDDAGFFDLLASGGSNYARIRVWNDPFDSKGNGYGGGNNDLNAAIKLGQLATNAGMKVLIDFHYSDFWADPGKQRAPKDWSDYTDDEKADAVYEYTKDAVQQLIDAGVDVGMVQIGNETNNGICGVTGSENMCKIFASGSKAVTDVDDSILVAIHYANVEKGRYSTYAAYLDKYGVDYDVFASSYYPIWHGGTDYLTSELEKIADTYDKKVMVVETQYAYTMEDGDGHENTIHDGATGQTYTYDISRQGQADEMSAVINAVVNTGDNGIGVFYWEPAWIPVQVYDADADNAEEVLSENKELWETYGSGWASSYAGEYDADDAGVYYGGSAVDNMAWFNFDGTPSDMVNIYSYVSTGATAPLSVLKASADDVTVKALETLSLPDTATVYYNDGTSEDIIVTWNEDDVNAVDTSVVGDYNVRGTVTASNGDSVELQITVTVEPENLLSDSGFEDNDGSWTVEGTGGAIKSDSSNVLSGSNCLHFWYGESFEFTATQTVNVDKGIYNASVNLQGGDADDTCVFKLIAEVGDDTYEATGSVSGWQVWSKLLIENIEVTEDNTDIKITIYTSAIAGAWGSYDDAYLYKSGDIETSDDATDSTSADTSDDASSADSSNTDNSNADNSATGSSVSDNTNETVETTDSNDTSDVTVAVTGVKLNKKKVSVGKGGTYQLTATIAPSNATNTDLIWTSSNKKVATVSKNGLVKAKKIGKATITVATKDGSYTAKCTVTVKKAVAVTKVKLNKKSKTLKIGKTYQLKATVKPTNATIKDVTFKSSNKKVATVDSTGKVTAKKKGTATITVTTKDGKFEATCKIKVK
jgi:arabinogalactan endo-1,4-beta-galactosidase